jgi:hypothetical protein
LRCTHRVPPLRALGRYRTSFASLSPAIARSGNAVGVLGRRAATAGAETVADLIDRWFNNYSGRGVGLYGGTWSYTGIRRVHMRLHGVRLERDLAVSGRIWYRPYLHRVSYRLDLVRTTRSGRPVSGSTVNGTMHGHWNTRRLRAVAQLTGRIGGRPLLASMVAP